VVITFAHAEWHERIRDLTDSEQVTATDDWGRFTARAGAASCLIVIQRWLGSEVIERLGALRRQLPLHPIVLATSKDADNARAVHRVAIEEVVWLHEMEVTLWPAVQQASQRAFRHVLAASIRATTGVSPVLRDALAVACTRELPFRSLGELASGIARSRGTIWNHWHRAFAGRGESPRAEDMVDWLILVHAVARKTNRRGWPDIACEIRVHEDTLLRIAKRLLGINMRDLAALDERAVMERFATDVLARIGVDCVDLSGPVRAPPLVERARTGSAP
jgi:hypothetical protein